MKNLKDLIKQREELNKLIDQEETQNIKWVKIGDLEWSECLGEMNWNNAMAKCKELGGRLPKRFELVELCDEFKEEIKDFQAGYYWSSTEYSATDARLVSFSSGSSTNHNKTHSGYVRCVRGCK